MGLLGSRASYGFDRGQLALGSIACLFVTAIMLGAAYGAGLITVFGYESRTSREGDLLGYEQSTEIGLKTLFLFEGQTYYVRYETEIEEGEFRFGLFRLPMRREYRDQGLRQVFTADASGEATWQVPATGLYMAYFAADDVIGERTHDVSYEVTWGARF